MKILKKIITCIIQISLLMLSLSALSTTISGYTDDFDPLVDLAVTVEIQKIRSLEKVDRQVFTREYIDSDSDPDFYLKVFINNEEFTSDIWEDTKYIYNPDWSANLNVPDDEEFVNIRIQLWDWSSDYDRLCDISGSDDYDVELVYSLKTGHWTGDDDSTGNDPSGYGRLNGCDDGTIYKRDLDCELWFNIFQNDFDNDGIPYWTEVNVYGTNPEINDIGEDLDEDDCPIEWEWKWGYNPLKWDDHQNIDPESDSINNYEEYLTSQWESDPFRKDLFIELDQMQASPNGQNNLLPAGAKEILYTVYNRQNVVYHLDDGSWENSGSDMIPFDDLTERDELNAIYQTYFVNEPGSDWKSGVFHYGVLIYQYYRVNGCAFGSNRFQVSSNGMEQKSNNPLLDKDTVYASAYMHETGHTFGFWPIGGHNGFSKYPWQIGWWIWRPYKSCMNYGYMYTTVDYSDGSRVILDYDDWTRMDMTYFEDGW